MSLRRLLETVKNSPWLSLALAGFSILGFISSVFAFFTNPNVPIWGRLVWLAVGGLFFLLLVASISIGLWGAFWIRVERIVSEHVEKELANPKVVAETSHGRSLKTAYVNTSRAYGLAYEFQRVSCAVADGGGARIKRQATLAAYAHVEAFFVYLLLPEYDEKGHLLPPEIGKVTKGRTLTVGEPVWMLSRQLSTVTITPPLEYGDTLEFTLVEGTDTGIYRTPHNHKRSKTRDDYLSWDVYYPTGELELHVKLPPEMRIESWAADAWYSIDTLQARHIEEYRRIRNLITAEDYTGYALALKVPNPLLSLTYVISWLPDESYTPSVHTQQKGGSAEI